MKSLALAKHKRARAVELAVQGRSYDEIAREVGYAHRGSAYKAVHKALSEREVDGVEELRRLELDRLDRLQTGLWPQAMAGDLAAVNAVLRIIDQRVRLLGLAQAGAGHATGPRYLVTGTAEDNPEEATGQTESLDRASGVRPATQGG